MESNLKKRYGLSTAIAMVVGTLIGSGVFFKAAPVLRATGGNLPIGILAWLIGGGVMIISALQFASMATRYEKINGLIDYAEAMCGEKYAYVVGWFMATIYLPSLTGVLAWVSATYFGVLFGLESTSGSVMIITLAILVGIYALNTLSPVLAGKFQVSTTVIKLIPLLLMAIVGTIVGLSNGTVFENFSNVVDPSITPSRGLLTAVCSTAFAYEGWIITTGINAELKDAKKNLPIALVIGTIIVVGVYVLYYVGLSGAVPNAELMELGDAGVKLAYGGLFGNVAGTLLMVFLVISCIGTTNGLMLGCVRGIYALSARGLGPSPKILSAVDERTNMPANSGIIGLFLASIWLLYFYGACLAPKSWFGFFSFDSSELPIITTYAFYIPIYISAMIKEKSLPFFKRFVLPSFAVLAAIVMIAAAIISHGVSNVAYIIIFAVIEVAGLLLMGKGKGEAKKA